MINLSCGDVYPIIDEFGFVGLLEIIDCTRFKVSVALETLESDKILYATPASVSCAILSGCLSFLR